MLGIPTRVEIAEIGNRPPNFLGILARLELRGCLVAGLLVAFFA